MQLGGQRGSDNVEDRRGIGLGAGGLGVGGVVVALIAYFLGFDPQVALDAAQQIAPARQEQAAKKGGPPDEMQVFVTKVLGSTEDVWTEVFRRSGQEYPAPKLVLFSGGTRTACGTGQTAMGPFYCPGDQKVYIDLSFYRELRERFHAPGDFAQAYVIAHEVGHHIQNVTGIMRKMEASQARGGSRGEANRTSVRMELQADCFAGVWAFNLGNRNLLDPGDLEEGLTAAAAIGDDRIQKQTQGTVVPDSFTHGSSEQRVRWFKRGMQSGKISSCDTFSAPQL